MPTNDNRPRIAPGGSRFGVPGHGLLAKLATMVAGILLLVAAFMLSLLVFAVVAVIAISILGYLWWKTRPLRQQIRERPPGGRVIEGEAIVDVMAEEEFNRRKSP